METLTGTTNFRITENYTDWDRGWRYATNLILNMHGLIGQSTNWKYQDIDFIESTETLNSTLSMRNKITIFNYYNPAIQWPKRLKMLFRLHETYIYMYVSLKYILTTLSEPPISAQLHDESFFYLNCMISSWHGFSPLFRIFLSGRIQRDLYCYVGLSNWDSPGMFSGLQLSIIPAHHNMNMISRGDGSHWIFIYS